jgi:hypothetical protein
MIIVFKFRNETKFVDILNMPLPQVDLMGGLLLTVCNLMRIHEIDHNVETVSHSVLPYINAYFNPLV